MILGILFFAGTSRMQSQMQFRETELAQIREGMDISLCGEIYKKEHKTDQLLIYLKNCCAVSNEEQVACNHVLLYSDSDTFSIGDILIVNGKVNMFQTATNEGMFDARSYYRSQKIDFVFYEANVKLARKNRFFLAEKLWSIRNLATKVLSAAADDITSGVMSVMLLGDKSSLDDQTKLLYQSMGISHILAISGIHVSLIGLGIYRFLRKRGMRYMYAFGISGVFLLLYAAMTGNSVSTKRAVGMLLLFMLGDLWGRAYDSLNALGGVGLYLLWINPFWMEYAGFVLSMAAVIGVTTVGKAIQIRTDGRETEDQCGTHGNEKETGRGMYGNEKEKQDVKCKFVNAIYIAVAIWLFTLPLIAFYYYEIPLYSALLNLFVVPLLKYLIVFGFVGVAIGLLGTACVFEWKWIVELLFLPCKWILNWYEAIAGICYSFPFSKVIVGKPSINRMICFYICLLFFALLWRKYRQKHWLRIAGVVLTTLILLIPTPKHFEVDVLDVGQGDGIYICSKEGILMFIDGGSSSVKNVGTYRILPFLKSHGAGFISYWFVSHPDADHISGLIEVLKSGYKVEHLVIAESLILSEEACELVEVAKRRGTEIVSLKAGDMMQFEETTITCLSPPTKQDEHGVDGANDLSLVLLYRDNDFSGMFAGDISSNVEQQIIEWYGDRRKLDVDFYKANHHGSKFSNCSKWLEVLSPEVAVISCGKKNPYGHPHGETIKRMEATGSKILRTDELGAIKLSISPSGEVKSEGYKRFVGHDSK